MTTMLCARDIRKRYSSVEALCGVDLELSAGEIYGLLGANGAGKTTLVSVIAGLVRPDAGTVHVDGIDALRNRAQVARLIGVAGQESGVYPALSVRRNLAFFAKLSGLRGAQLRSRLDETADAFGLTEILDRQASLLSGGQVRRLHAAMAVVGKPRLLLLDEPTVGVDVATRGRMLELVHRLAREGTAICYTTHYLSELEVLGGPVGVLEGGRIIVTGPLGDLLQRHGESAAELRFRESVPQGCLGALAHRVHLEYAGDVIRIRGVNPSEVIGDALAILPSRLTERLLSVEILRPSLDTVFLSVTGRRFAGAPTTPEKELQ